MVGVRMDRAKRALFVSRVARRGGVLRVLKDWASGGASRPPPKARGSFVRRCRSWAPRTCAAFVLGLYMVWKIIRTPGEL
jgi:hypothetical protein